MNLEDLNLVELNAQEVQEVEGGTWPSIGWWMDVAFSYGSSDTGRSSLHPLPETA